MTNNEKILNEFLQKNEAVDAEVTGGTVYLSLEDVLTLMNRATNVPSQIKLMLNAAQTIANWMQWWLNENECDCIDGHICGRIERQKELDEFYRALNEFKGEV